MLLPSSTPPTSRRLSIYDLMHSWIFRHRERLSAVFGMVTGEPVNAPSEASQEAAEPAEEIEVIPAVPCNSRLGIPPGGFARRERYVVLAPMTRPIR